MAVWSTKYLQAARVLNSTDNRELNVVTAELPECSLRVAGVLNWNIINLLILPMFHLYEKNVCNLQPEHMFPAFLSWVQTLALIVLRCIFICIIINCVHFF